MKILIIRIDHIGDVLLCTPMVRSLSKAGHHVSIIVSRQNMCIFNGNPYVTEVYALEDLCPDFPKRWWILSKWIRLQHYNALILPHAQPRELLFASLLSGVRKRIAMWARFLGRLTFHHCLRSGIKKGHRHFSDIILDCARALHITTDGLKLDFFLTEEERRAAREEMSARFPGLNIVGIHPGCTGNTCNLPSRVYGKLALRLIEMENIAVVGTGIAREMYLFETWPLKVLNHSRFYNACGKWTLRELAARMSTFSIMVVVGTGPLHIANALELKTVSPFCVTPELSAAVWGNLTQGSITISPPDEYCLARRKHPQDHCDFGGRISIDDMYQAVMKSMKI